MVAIQCELDFCDRKRYAKTPGLCATHLKYKRMGKPLEPLTSSGKHGSRPNRIDGECDFEGCDRKRTGTGFCNTHNQQHKKYNQMWPVGERRPGWQSKTIEGRNGYMGTEYTPQRTCVRCGETKEWQRFCLGTEHMKDVCRDCNRKALSQQALEGPRRHHSSTKNKNGMADLLAFLEARTGADSDTQQT